MTDRTPDETPLYPDERPRATPAATPTRAPRKSRTGLKLLGLLVLLPAVELPLAPSLGFVAESSPPQAAAVTPAERTNTKVKLKFRIGCSQF